MHIILFVVAVQKKLITESAKNASDSVTSNESGIHVLGHGSLGGTTIMFSVALESNLSRRRGLRYSRQTPILLFRIETFIGLDGLVCFTGLAEVIVIGSIVRRSRTFRANSFPQVSTKTKWKHIFPMGPANVKIDLPGQTIHRHVRMSLCHLRFA